MLCQLFIQKLLPYWLLFTTDDGGSTVAERSGNKQSFWKPVNGDFSTTVFTLVDNVIQSVQKVTTINNGNVDLKFEPYFVNSMLLVPKQEE